MLQENKKRLAKMQGKIDKGSATAGDELETQPTNDAVGVRAVLRKFQKLYMEEVGKEQFRIATSTDGKVRCFDSLTPRLLCRGSTVGQTCKL